MTMTLRALIVVTLSFITGLVGLSAHAQTNYPTKPVTIIVPYGPGSGNDMISR